MVLLIATEHAQDLLVAVAAPVTPAVHARRDQPTQQFKRLLVGELLVGGDQKQRGRRSVSGEHRKARRLGGTTVILVELRRQQPQYPGNSAPHDTVMVEAVLLEKTPRAPRQRFQRFVENSQHPDQLTH